jgi:hypothetical protein
MRDILNSSNKIIGYTDIIDNKIIIHNNKKPELIIEDEEILKAILEKDRNNTIIKKMYDEYFLTIGEIASLYNVCYSNINKQIRNIKVETTKNQGRRNSSYGKTFSQERKNNISKALKKGYEEGTIKPPQPYERTPEIRAKISKSLKEYFKEHPQDPTPHINNWKKGIYDNVDFHIGIGGKFYSHKNSKEFRFRSLLELFYCLMLEKDNSIIKYSYETIKINCDNGHIYTPDLLLNDNILIELKSKKYVNNVKGVLEKVQYKKEQAEKYCASHNLVYKIIYDEDINFESRNFKRYLNNNPQIIEYYKIVFNQPERMVLK